MKKDFMLAVEQRRSIYALDNNITVSIEKIEEIVKHSVLWSPSAFNSQTARAVILFGEQHQKLWRETKEILRKIIPSEAFGSTEAKIEGFIAGAGTILFFEDQVIIAELQKKFVTYADKFPLFSLQSSGMTQYIVWTALEIEGLGASLQHYSPLIDHFVQEEWGISKEWHLLSQMVFGNPIAPASEKSFAPIEGRVVVKR